MADRTAKRVYNWMSTGSHTKAEAKAEIEKRVKQALTQPASKPEALATVPVQSRASKIYEFRVSKPRVGTVNDRTIEGPERTYLHGYYGARRPGLGPVGRASDVLHPSKSLTYRRRLELGYAMTGTSVSKIFVICDPIGLYVGMAYHVLTQTAVTTAHAGDLVTDYYPSQMLATSATNLQLTWTNSTNIANVVTANMSVVLDTVNPPSVEGAAFSPLGGSMVVNVGTPQTGGGDWILNGPDTVPAFIDRCGTLQPIASSAEGGIEAPSVIGTVSLVNPATTTSDLVLHLQNVGAYGGYIENQAALSKRWGVQLMDPPAVNWIRAISDQSTGDLQSYYNALYTQQGARSASLGAAQFYASLAPGSTVSVDFAYDYAIATGEASPLRALRSVNAVIPPGNIETRVNAGCNGFGDSFKEAYRNAVAASKANALSNGGSIARLVNPDKIVEEIELNTAPGLVNSMLS